MSIHIKHLSKNRITGTHHHLYEDWYKFQSHSAQEDDMCSFVCLYLFIFQASSAKWEPPHGRFVHIFYPWSEYVKVGAVLRYCTYEVMALHGVLHSEIQVCKLII